MTLNEDIRVYYIKLNSGEEILSDLSVCHDQTILENPLLLNQNNGRFSFRHLVQFNDNKSISIDSVSISYMYEIGKPYLNDYIITLQQLSNISDKDDKLILDVSDQVH